MYWRSSMNGYSLKLAPTIQKWTHNDKLFFLSYFKTIGYLCAMNTKLDAQNQTPARIIQLLGQRYKDTRIAMQITQKEVSEKTGISMSTIRRFEKEANGTSLRLTTWHSLASIRGTSSIQPIISTWTVKEFSNFLLDLFLGFTVTVIC